MLRTVIALATSVAAWAALLAVPVLPASAEPTAPASRARPCVRAFPVPGSDPAAFGITAGPGGTWYSNGGELVVVTGSTVRTIPVPDPDQAYVGWLTRDGDKVWFADRGTGRLGTVTAAGAVHEMQIPDGLNAQAVPQAIVLDRHRGVWFTDQANDRLGYYALASGAFTFYAVPSAFPLGLVQAGDGDLYFTERSVDKVARFDPTTHLFTEWTLGTDAFPNRLAVAGDGTVWFTTLHDSAVWHIRRGYLNRYALAGGPVGIKYWHGHLWTALFTAGAVARLSAHGHLQRTYALPAGSDPLQIAGSRGYIWTTGSTAVYRIAPRC